MVERALVALILIMGLRVTTLAGGTNTLPTIQEEPEGEVRLLGGAANDWSTSFTTRTNLTIEEAIATPSGAYLEKRDRSASFTSAILGGPRRSLLSVSFLRASEFTNRLGLAGTSARLPDLDKTSKVTPERDVKKWSPKK